MAAMTAATMASGESAVVAERGANAEAATTGVTVASAVNGAAGRVVLADLRNRSLTWPFCGGHLLEDAMKFRQSLITIASALTLAGAVAACSPAEQESTEAEVSEEAAQIGEAIEAGAREVAQEVDQATDDLAAEAEEQEAETAADDQSTTGDMAAADAAH